MFTWFCGARETGYLLAWKKVKYTFIIPYPYPDYGPKAHDNQRTWWLLLMLPIHIGVLYIYSEIHGKTFDGTLYPESMYA